MSIKAILSSPDNGVAAEILSHDLTQSGRHALAVYIAGIADKDFSIPIVSGSYGVPHEMYFLNVSSKALNVNGSVTPQVFTVAAMADADFLINEITIVGYDGGIKSSYFMGISGGLTNGLLISGKGSNEAILGNNIKTTAQLVEFSSSSDWRIFSDSSADTLKVTQTTPFVLKKQLTYGYGNDDYLTITVRDNLSTIDYLVAYVRGVLR